MGRRFFIIGLLAVAVGLIYVSHNFLISYFLGDKEYFPINAATSATSDAVFYGPRVNAVFRGQWIAGDINIFENKESPALLPILNPLILGIMAKVSGSIKTAFIFSDFIFPILIFIAIYLLAFELCGGRLAPALFFASLFIFSPRIGLWPAPDALSFFTENKALYFSRLEYPKITYLFFALGFYFAYRAILYSRRKDIICGGLAFGAMFYSYLYDWVYFLTGLVIMAVLFAFRKEFQKSRSLILIILIGFLASSFYWLNFFNLHNLPDYGDLVERIGAELGRYFRFSAWTSYLRGIFLIAALWFFAKKEKMSAFIYLASFLAAYFAVLNLQLVTGFNPQPDHWYRVGFLAIDLSIFMLALWIFEKYADLNFFRRLFRHSGIALFVFIILMLARASFSQYAFSKENSSTFALNEAYAASYRWLNESTPEESAVGAFSPLTNNEIVLHTHNKIFLPNGANSTVASGEIFKRAEITAKVFGLSQAAFGDFLAKNSFYLFHNKYRDHSFDSFFKEGYRLLPSKDIEEAVLKYGEGPILPAFGARLDYLLYGPRDAALGSDPAALLRSLIKVYDSNQVVIYKTANQ